MAGAFVFRLIYQLSVATLRYCISQGCSTEDWENAYRRYKQDLEDITADPDEISAGMSESIGAPEGGTIIVTDFTGTFELRKLQWRISRAPAGRIEDVDVCTFHFIKVSGGVPVAWNDSTDLAALETLFNTYWGSIKTLYPTFMHLDQYRWYKDGPAFYELNGDGTAYVPKGDNVAVRVTEVDVAGTAGASPQLPPQCAHTVTERTSSKRHWGRWYLPGTQGSALDNTGLLGTGPLGTFLTASVTLYNAARAAGSLPVVWSIQKPERPKKPHGTLPPAPAAAYEVTSLQMDDLVDVIRSRRFQNGVTKTNTVLT